MSSITNFSVPAQDKTNLTASQLMMWTGQQLQPDDPLYNMALAFRIQGHIDVRLFQAAFKQLIDDADAMRTVIEATDGVPCQRVLPTLDVDLAVHDFSALDDPEATVKAWLDERVRRPFDLTECLFDSALLILDDANYLWYFNQHHVITDAWAVSLVFEHVSQAYLALERQPDGQEKLSARLPQFADYVAQELEQRESAAFAKSAQYWRDVDVSKSGDLHFYRPVNNKPRGRTERSTLSLGANRTQRLRELIKTPSFQSLSTDLALQQTFATVLFAYLNRITGQEDLVIGTPAHNRNTASRKQTLGPFIDMFPMPVAVAQDDSFVTLYQRVSIAARQMLLHSAPGSCGVAAARSFQVVLNFITASFSDFAGRPALADWLHAGAGDRNHVLRLQVHDFNRGESGMPDDITLHFDANVDVFTDSDRYSMKQHFLYLLDALLDQPSQSVQAVPLVSPVDAVKLQQQLTGPTSMTNGTVLDTFSTIAQNQPNAIAALHEDARLSYGELDAAANKVVEQLQLLKLEPGAHIALFMPRGFGMLAGMLGVLKSGSAFVPIDTDYPPGRIQKIIENAGLQALLIDIDSSALVSQEVRDWASQSGVPLISVDPNQRLESCPLPSVTPSDLAYVMHTSGSTGQPKGVKIAHAALANYASFASRTYVQADAEPLVFPLFTSIGFDLTITSIFAPLTSGGRVVIYTPRGDAREILIQRVVSDNRVNAVKLTPSHLSLLLALDLVGSKIRTLVVGGEELRTDLANQVVQRIGSGCAIYNEYGPTEATVGCVVHRFDPKIDQAVTVPIGRAIDNFQVQILNPALQLVPQGAVGTLWVSGVGVAQGYLNRADTTQERFQPNPYIPGAVMYNTGDLVRLEENGQLAYLGRNDAQVKIRGVRIEPGEIEAALVRHPMIHEAVVIATQVRTQESRFCVECGLDGRHPDAQIDDSGVCTLCQLFAQERQAAMEYFRPFAELENMVPGIKAETATGPDCIMLLSGGKDSSYALCRVVELGLRPLVFTLDNGFISAEALANAQRIVDKYGLELHVAKTPAMNDIFVDSLQRFSNVCNGCFKTIYTLSMNLARELGIKTIFTGLSRGQIFETRLAEFFKRKVFDAKEIDRQIIEARKIYHRMDDAVTRALNTDIYADDAVFDEIRFVDFYRYSDVTLDEVYAYLATRASWIRPRDTGRSTNCLINEAGIHVHKTERGFHNYALPYSWDVRLGHKQRDAARAELDDDINHESVVKILGEIGYEIPDGFDDVTAKRQLVAYYVADESIAPTELREHLQTWLPKEMIPRSFVQLADLPLTVNGKVDIAALPSVDQAPRLREAKYVAPRNSTETELCRIWEAVLGVAQVGIEEDFFDLGGDSILNIQIVAQARASGIVVSPEQIFEFTNIARLAAVSGTQVTVADQGEVLGPTPLLPMQSRFFTEGWAAPADFAQIVHLQVALPITASHLQTLLQALLYQHDGLRAAFHAVEDQWQQELLPTRALGVVVEQFPAGVSQDDMQTRLTAQLSIGEGRLLVAGLYERSGQTQMILAIHHLAVDAVSWGILLEDLAALADAGRGGNDESDIADLLPAKTMSLPAWSGELTQWSQTQAAQNELEYWLAQGNAGLAFIDPEQPQRVARRSKKLISLRLPPEHTDLLLGEAARRHRVQVPELLLSALSLAVSGSDWYARQTAPSDVLRIDIESHGRERFSASTDLLRTVGWFTALHPLLLPLVQHRQPTDTLGLVREALRTIPNRGAGYGVLREAHAGLAGQPQAAILFNYLGQWDKTLQESSWFQITQPLRLHADLDTPGAHPLELNTSVFEGCLQMDWSYSPMLFAMRRVQQLSEAFIGALELLIKSPAGSERESPAPSDFPEAQLSQDDLDDLLAEFGND